MKIVHAADLHLDSPLRGLPSYEGAPVAEVRSATRRALVALIDACLEEEASLLLLAGDLYDGDYRDYGTALFLVEQLGRLRELGCRVVWLRGNHDAQSQITRHLRLPAHVFELSTAEPETRSFEELGVSIHGQGYATRELKENLARRYPSPVPGHFNVGLLHTALDGSRGHDPYAPCSVADLVARGFDYWALGHVHRHEILPGPVPIAYPGNLQGRHARETGPKGALVLEVDGGRLTKLTHRSLDVVRWEVGRVDATSAGSFVDVVEQAGSDMLRLQETTEGRTLACRVVVEAPARLQGELMVRQEELLAELRRQSIELGAYLERVEVRAARSAGEWEGSSPLSRQILERARHLAADPVELGEWRSALCAPLGAVSAELLREEDFGELLVEAAELLEGRLTGDPDEDERA